MLDRLTERKLLNAFVDSLQEIPDVQIGDIQPNVKFDSFELDAQLDLTVAHKDFNLIIEFKKHGYPRDVQQAIWHLKRSDRLSTLIRILYSY